MSHAKSGDAGGEDSANGRWPGCSSPTLRRRIAPAVVWCVAFILGGSPTWGQEAPALHLRPANAVFDTPGQEFSLVTGLRELEDGRVLVADRTQNLLTLIDWGPGSATRVGREGDGPGEYRGVAWMYALGGDSTLLTDPTARHWYVLDGPRIVERIVGGARLGSLLNPLLSGADASDHVLGVMASMQSFGLPGYREASDSLYLVLGTIGSERLDTLTRLKGQAAQALPRRFPSAGPAMAFPFLTEDLGLLCHDGWVAVARLDPYRVDWRKPDGEWIRGEPLPFTPQPIEDPDKCLAVRMLDATERPCNPEAVSAPETLPPFLWISSRAMVGFQTSTLMEAPDGKLLIRRTPSAASPGSRYDLVDRGGELAGTLTLPANEAVIGFGRRSVYVLVMDKWGLETLRRHPWP